MVRQSNHAPFKPFMSPAVHSFERFKLSLPSVPKWILFEGCNAEFPLAGVLRMSHDSMHERQRKRHERGDQGGAA